MARRPSSKLSRKNADHGKSSENRSARLWKFNKAEYTHIMKYTMDLISDAGTDMIRRKQDPV